MFLKWEGTLFWLWEDNKWLLLWYSGTELIKFKEIYLEDGLEIAGSLVITPGETAKRLLIHIMVLRCMFLCSTWQKTSTTGETLLSRLENGLERKGIIYISLLDDVGVSERLLKIKQMANK